MNTLNPFRLLKYNKQVLLKSVRSVNFSLKCSEIIVTKMSFFFKFYQKMIDDNPTQLICLEKGI